MRRLKTFVLLGGLLCGGWPSPAGAQSSPPNSPLTWPLTWNSAEQPTFFQVPVGQRQQHVTLRLRLGRLPQALNDQPLRANVLLDGQTVDVVALSPSLTVHLPDLEPGIHAVRLQTAGDAPPGSCASVGQPLPLLGASVQFQQVITGEPPISHLPDGLFLPGRPEVVVGSFSVDEWTDDTLNAALGLAQLLSGTRPVIWQSQTSRQTGGQTGGQTSSTDLPTADLPTADLPTDFRVTLRRDAGLSAPARIELHWGQLVVRYRQPQDLPQVVSTLASAEVRRTLTRSRADLTTLTLLPRPDLRPPRTLGELGVGQYRVRGGEVVNQALMIPPMWQAKGPPSGLIHYRLPTPRTNQEQVTLIVGGRRNNISPDGAQSVEGQDVQARFEGAQPAGGGLDFTVQARGLARCDSGLDVLPDSQINLQLRARSGLAGLPRLLTRDPSVLLPADPQSISVALNIAASLRGWGLSDVLPWQAHLLDPQRDIVQPKATLTLQPQQSTQTSTTTARLTMTQPLLLKPQVTLTFAPGAQATALGRTWNRVPDQLGGQVSGQQDGQQAGQQLGDHLYDAFIGSSGQVQAADTPQAAAPSPLRRYALWFSLLTLPLLALWSWQRERRGRR